MRILHSYFLAVSTIAAFFDAGNDVAAQDFDELVDLPGRVVRQESEDAPSFYGKSDLVRDLMSLKNRNGKTKRTKELIQQLGSDQFDVRSKAEKDLATEPEISIDELVAAARSDPAIEIRYRVQRILEKSSVGRQLISRNQKYSRIVACLESDAGKNFQGIIPLLFEVADFMDSDDLLDAAGRYVFDVATKEDRESFLKYLTDGKKSRLLAVYGLGKSESDEDLATLRSFLESADSQLVLASAHMLAVHNDRKALSVLIHFLSSSNRHLRVKSTQILRGWTGKQFGFNPYVEPKTQTNQISAWRSWYVHRSNETVLTRGFRMAILPEDLDHGLLVHYTFEKFAIGKFQNSIDQKYSGLTRNSVDWVYRGSSKAIRFHGAGKHGSRGGHALIDPVKFDTLKEFTVSLWVKETGLIHDEGEAFITFGIDGGVTRDDSLGIAHFNELIIYRTGNGEVAVPYDPDDHEKWVHYAMTFKKDLITGYKNGKWAGRSPGKVNVKSSRAALARHWWGNGVGTSTRLQAAMDDVRIYRRALTPSQIEYLVESTKE